MIRVHEPLSRDHFTLRNQVAPLRSKHIAISDDQHTCGPYCDFSKSGSDADENIQSNSHYSDSSTDQFTFSSPTPDSSSSPYGYYARKYGEGVPRKNNFTSAFKICTSSSTDIIETWPLHQTKHGSQNPVYSERAKEIAKHKEEMFELIQDAPETCYELSLKDLVDLPSIVAGERETGSGKGKVTGSRSVKRAERKYPEAEALEQNSHLLKMFFPSPCAGKKPQGTPIPTPKTSPKYESNGSGKSDSHSSSTSSNISISRASSIGCCTRY